MIIFGIDPGVSGAISVLENKKVIEIYDMPTMIDGKKNKKQVNGSQVTNIIKERLNNDKEIIVEALTDNKNRTASNIRTIFQKFGGNLGAPGVASYQFRQVGIIRIDKNKISDNNILELAINVGAENCSSNGKYHEVITAKDNFYKVKLEIEKKIQEFISSGIEWLPKNKISLDLEKTKSVLDFLETLENDDDIEHVYANLEIDNNFKEKNLV